MNGIIKHLYVDKKYSIKRTAKTIGKSRYFVRDRLIKIGIEIIVSPYSKSGKDHPHYRSGPKWKGGKRITSWGYVKIKNAEHPHSDCDDYVFEHRLIMEKHLNRFLTPLEIVHHIDGNILNNDISNLQLFSSNSEHTKFERDLKYGNKPYNNKDILVELYIIKNVPVSQIASKLNCHVRSRAPRGRVD